MGPTFDRAARGGDLRKRLDRTGDFPTREEIERAKTTEYDLPAGRGLACGKHKATKAAQCYGAVGRVTSTITQSCASMHSNQEFFMRYILATAIIVAVFSTNAAADMTQEEKNYHAIHGLFHMYAVGSIFYYNKWSFTKQDTDEMLKKIGELSKDGPQKNVEVMWSETRAMMAEGQDKTTASSCAMVHE